MASENSVSVQSKPIIIRRLWWVGLLAAASATITNLVIFAISSNLFGVNFMVNSPGSTELAPLPLGMVIAATVIPALVGTILLALIGRFVLRPILVFRILSGLVLLLSFGSPLSLPVDVTVKVILSLMHVVAAGTIVGLLTTMGRER